MPIHAARLALTRSVTQKAVDPSMGPALRVLVSFPMLPPLLRREQRRKGQGRFGQSPRGDTLGTYQPGHRPPVQIGGETRGRNLQTVTVTAFFSRSITLERGRDTTLVSTCSCTIYTIGRQGQRAAASATIISVCLVYITLPVLGSMRLPATKPVVGSVPFGRRKSRMCGSGLAVAGAVAGSERATRWRMRQGRRWIAGRAGGWHLWMA